MTSHDVSDALLVACCYQKYMLNVVWKFHLLSSIPETHLRDHGTPDNSFFSARAKDSSEARHQEP